MVFFSCFLLVWTKQCPQRTGHQSVTVDNVFLRPIFSSLLTSPNFPFLGSDLTPFTVLVANSVKVTPCKNYTTAVVFRGILLGGLKRLQNSTKDFMSVHYFFKLKR